MTTLTVLTPDAATTIEGAVTDGRIVVAPAAVETVLGWDLKPEGLCRADVCVPVREDAGLSVGDEVDLATAARLLGSSVLVDEISAVVAISVASDRRSAALRGRRAGDFTLPDLDGTLHSLEEFADRKRLLVAFASW